MKSIYHGKAAANAKLRGKCLMPLSCRCCCLINITRFERVKEAEKEIRDFVKGKDDDNLH